MPLGDINNVFSAIANLINEDKSKPGEVAVAVAGLALVRIIVTDLRRIADAQEAIANEYARVQAGTK